MLDETDYKVIKCPNLWNKWTNSVFFAAQVVTTVGYGNQYPKTDNGMIFIIFYAMICVPIVNYAMGMYSVLFRQMIVWLREKIFGPDPAWWKSYLVTFTCLLVFTGLFVVLFVLIFQDVEGRDGK